MNNRELKILCLEDVESDAIIIREQLNREGLKLQFDHVYNEIEFTHKLQSGNYDVILSDYNLPGFNGIAALLLSKKICPDIPFICISGTIGEDLAVELMHLGASDYIIKDKLSKLPVAIHRVIKEAEERSSRLRAEKLLIESEARFRDILMSSNDWVWEIDMNGKYCYASEAIEIILGYTNEEVTGKSPFDFMPDDEKEKVGSVFSEITGSKGVIKYLENWNLHKNGHRICLLTNGFPIFDDDGNLTGYRGVDKDITERKRLTTDLIEAKQRAEASNKLKTAFLNNISHEVRTPLNGILGFSEFVLQPDIQQEEKELYLEILNESSERLVNTITNYMDMSLIVSGNMSVKSKNINIAAVLDTVYKKSSPKCSKKNLDFIKQVPSDLKIQIITDDVLLEKALDHLVDNAVKFTDKGRITLGIRNSENEIELFVQDTGSGIDQEIQSSVFQIFMQEDLADTRGYEGSGLGLSITKGLIELMGGKIRMESEKGKGSAFFLTLPLVKNKSKEIMSPDKTKSIINKSDSAVILIAEDDESNSSLLITVLKRASLKHLVAFNGAEAVELCRTHPEITLVIMDIKMPVMDGFSATRKIKEFRKDLPIIGVTAYAMTGDRDRALEAGCDDYLAKPVKSDQLIALIHSYIYSKFNLQQ
jgi:PAS domain S-box-containing protein